MKDPFDDDPWLPGAPLAPPVSDAASRRRSPLLAWAAAVVAAAAAVTPVAASVSFAAYAVALSCYSLVLCCACYQSWRVPDSTAQRELPGAIRWVLRPVGFLAVLVAAWNAAEALAL